jgi:hypothetical protein
MPVALDEGSLVGSGSAPASERADDPEPGAARRQTEPALRLVRDAVGGPREIAAKARRIGRTLRLWLDRDEIGRRLDRLEALGFVRNRPGRAQLFFGALDMLRFVIEPASRDYYRQRGVHFGFHQLLRWLDDPVSLLDPTGFLSDRDTIVGHVMQVVHLNPVYDLQLIQMFPDGLDDFERQVRAMVEGTHPRARTIGAIVEDPGYHARLLAYVQRYRANPETPPLVRTEQTLRADPHFAAAERTFATLPGYVDYCNRLPSRSVFALWRRLRSVEKFPLELAADSH